jgi:hypothetical protein
VGMELAAKLLETCGDGVNRLGVEEPSDRITELETAYLTLEEHGANCGKCNEVGNDPNSKGNGPQSDRIGEA